LIPGEHSSRFDLRSGAVALVQESALLYGGASSDFALLDSLYGEHRNDIIAAAARHAGERDTFVRTTTADRR